MKLSEFRRSMEEEFGRGYAPVVAAQTVLDAAGDRTADEALAAGMPPLAVWQAVCRQHDLPAERWLGADPGEPR